ncbi:peptidoglycan-binding protein [Nitratireductor sp. OM-1]|uniref:peptidoglycan-binding protein n=1 Tax=Nitratireductor sp. OM-1 TaxID=1756988 RepID=UPI0013AF5AEE|nr:peptidoglycan-binding protein [Nitratireductor sp. OM-1]
MVTKSELRKFLPNAKSALVDAVVRNWHAAERARIVTPARKRQFFANIATETGGLTKLVESMTYSSASRIRQTWPSRFASDAEARPYVRQAKKLAIKVYGGRMGNAAYPSDDGWRFRGGGMMMTSGRAGYRSMGFEDNPSVLQRDADRAFLAAVREWQNRGCNGLADRGDTKGVRRAINGGLIGLNHVEHYLVQALAVWPDVAATHGITDKGTVQHVQRKLKALGYTEVGADDGIIGRFTRTAILAFRSDNGLPLATIIDHDLLGALRVARPRAVDPGRSKAPVSDVAKRVPEVKANWWSKVLSAFTALGSGTAALVTGTADHLGAAKAYVEPVKEYASSIPTPLWLVVIAGIALAIFIISRNGERKGVEAFHTGERR